MANEDKKDFNAMLRDKKDMPKFQIITDPKSIEKYAKKAKEATAAYEKEFGPLSVQDTPNKTPFEWVQGPWPWEYQN